MSFLNLLYLLGIFLIGSGFFLLMLVIVKGKNNENIPRKRKPKTLKPAILIPARDESKVIRGLLESIQKQTVSICMKDVYVIVETKEDPTVGICKLFGVSVVFRHDLTKKRKGYALDDAIHEILKEKKHYDLYFVFDADNILAEDYLSLMMEKCLEGYDIATGYRNSKNGNTNATSACSSLTFSMINTISNRMRSKYQQNITISGTGFYIDGKILESLGGYPFSTLTEDYELSLYATLHGFTTTYQEKAEYFDEQPTSFSVSCTQRTRWVRGFLQARRLYLPKLKEKHRRKQKNYGSIFSAIYTIRAYLWMVAGIVLLLGIQLIMMIYKVVQSSKIWLLCFERFFLVLFLLYMVLFLFTICMLYLERKRFSFTKATYLKAALFNPIFLISYLPCAIKAVFCKNLDWKKIEHHGN